LGVCVCGGGGVVKGVVCMMELDADFRTVVVWGDCLYDGTRCRLLNLLLFGPGCMMN